MSFSSQSRLDRRNMLKWGAGLGAVAAASLSPFAFPGGTLSARAEAEALTLWGIPASPSAIFARAVASGDLEALAPGMRFDVWKSTDQMRAGHRIG